MRRIMIVQYRNAFTAPAADVGATCRGGSSRHNIHPPHLLIDVRKFRCIVIRVVF